MAVTSQDDVTLVEHEQLPAVTSSSAVPDQVDYISDVTLANGRTSDDVTQQNRTVGDDVTNPPPGGGEAYVYYSGTGGGSAVVKQRALVATPDGGVQIVIPRTENVSSEERPLREKDIRCLLIFGVLSIFLFPPLGIAAMVYALLTRKEFREGLSKGDLTLARKMSRKCEKLVIFSLILGLVTYVIVFAFVEKNARHHGTDHWMSHLAHPGG